MINKKINTYSIVILLFCVLYLNGSTLYAQNAVITESQKEFITYPYSEPNPVADCGRIYPYFKFDGYSHKGNPQKWKVVTLENQYIKVFVMPEIGGKIWGAMEKASGEMFIYYNHVVKFRNIAMRGPWTSGGIELNFGIIGHTPTGASPIDYFLQNNNDGSVSCFVGALDLITGTTWRVEIRLPKDKAYFETKVLWHNDTPLNQPYYHWMNGSARAGDDLQFFFPGHSHISHGGEPFPWPSHENGHNLSQYAENNFGPAKSYHVLGEYTEFFGGYYFKNHFGFGNWSEYSDKPGKKLWIWGLSRQGMVWEDLLTDTDGQYIEMQTGRLFNQAAQSSGETPFKHREFPPYSTDTWSEIWFPVKQTEGMKSATPFGVLNAESNEDQLKIYFSPLQKIDDDLVVKSENEIIYSKHLNLKPLEIFIDSLKIKHGDNIQVCVGQNKLSYSTADKGNNSIDRPLISPQNFDWNSIQGLAIKGKEASRQLNYDTAMESYLQCLEKDPNFIAALTGVAELYYRRMDYDTALSYAKRALAIDTYDGAANFIYGSINRKSNLIADAKDGFSIASHSVEYRSAAFSELAEMYAREENWNKAFDYSKRALDFNSYNLSAARIQIIAMRKQNLISETRESINDLLKLDPLNHFARFEKYILTGDPKFLKEFKQLIRNELPSETFLDIAINYYNLGLLKEALQVLENAPVNPIVNYWEAYLFSQLGDNDKSNSLLKNAEDQLPYLVFPFREETADLFCWVINKRDNWKGKYYLALINWKKGNLEKAKELFALCKEEPDYSPFYLARAGAFNTSNMIQSVNDINKAIEYDNKDWRAWTMLSNLYDNVDDQKKSLIAIENIYKLMPDDYRVEILYAKALYRSKMYSECVPILDRVQVLPYEGLRDTRVLYNKVYIMLAVESIQKNEWQQALIHLDKARLWPENLGAGKPYDTDEIIEDYLEWYMSESVGDTEKSAELIIELKNQIAFNRRSNSPNNLIAALVLRKLGKEQEAMQYLESWNKMLPDNNLTQWALAVFNGETEKADTLFEMVKNNFDIRIYFQQPINDLINLPCN